jgi:pyruvate formate lyase activating enzyme
VRGNFSGALYTAVGEYLAAVNLDPVEKKPLFHFLPGSLTFSVGSLGCNLHCEFCQNSGISQLSDACRQNPALIKPGHRADAHGIVKAALESGAASISYTYNEPTVFFELMQDTAGLALERGLRNIMVSNAYMSGECFSALDGLIQAANFDLKSFSPEFYRTRCKAELAPVLENIKAAVKSGWWVEVTTLLIGGLNDGPAELDALAGFIANELGPEVPWHVSRFHPAYLMRDRPATPVECIELALECGQKHGLRHIYAGNLPGHASESTLCPACSAVTLARHGYRTRALGEIRGRCPSCGQAVAGVWE